jgi:hypothetical protein
MLLSRGVVQMMFTTAAVKPLGFARLQFASGLITAVLLIFVCKSVSCIRRMIQDV